MMWRNLLYLAEVLYLKIPLLNFTSCFYKLSTRNSCCTTSLFTRFLFMVTEILPKVFLFAAIVKLNGRNNCIKSFPFSRYKEKQVSVSCFAKRFHFQFLKNINRKTIFPVVLQTPKNSLIFPEDNTCNTPLFRRITGSSS